MGTLRGVDTGPGIARSLWAVALLAVTLVASGCELVDLVAQPTLGPTASAGRGRRARPGPGVCFGLRDHRPGRLGRGGRGPDPASPVPCRAPPGRRCGPTPRMAPRPARSTWRCHPRGPSLPVVTRAWAPPIPSRSHAWTWASADRPSWSPNRGQGLCRHSADSTLGTRPRRAASDPGTPRDVLYALAWWSGPGSCVRSVLGTFRFLPVPASSPEPAPSHVPALIRQIALGI